MKEQHRIFLRLVEDAARNDRPKYIFIICLLILQSNKPLDERNRFAEDLITGSRGDLKRAIRSARIAQAMHPQYASDYERVIKYIRKELLHREVNAT